MAWISTAGMTISDLMKVFNTYPLHTEVRFENQAMPLVSLPITKIEPKQLYEPVLGCDRQVLVVGSK